MRKAYEVHHHKPEEVGEYLRAALAMLDVEELQPENHDQTLAALVNLLAGKQVWYEQVSPTGVMLGRNGPQVGG